MASLTEAKAAAESNSSAALAVNPNKALWEKGDFTQIAATMRVSWHLRTATLKKGTRPT